MELIDTHAHLDFPQFDSDREEVIELALAAGVGCILNVGADLASSQRAVALAEAHPQIYAAVGVHPHDAKTLTDELLAELRELACHPKVVAIGEIGLDFYRNLSPRDVQRKAFERQLALAQELGKPVIIHDRDAHADVMEILRCRRGLRGVLHCFSGSLEMAREAIELGFYISVAGPVTFKNARRPPEIVHQLPLERLLIETDSPYLAPHPYRGRRNEPAYVRLVAEAIAEIRGLPLEEVARVTTANARVLFGLK